MTADEVQAAIARGLVSSENFTDAMGKGLPLALQDDLRLFRGFIARIKHTQLRRIVPLTLRLLAVHRLDIAFFAHIAPAYLAARIEAPIPPEWLFERFERELQIWLAEAPEQGRTQTEAMLRHEARIWRTGLATRQAKSTPYPVLLGDVAVERFQLDVVALGEAIANDPFETPLAETMDHFVMYRKFNEIVRIEAIDGLSAWLLSRLDGSTPTAVLVEELNSAIGVDAEAAVHGLLADAAARQLIGLGGR